MRSRANGMSLVSLMIAMAIGLFLSLGLFDLWYNAQRTFSTSEQLAALQDNERMVSLILQNSISLAGYYPLSTDYATNPPTMTFSATSFAADAMFPAGIEISGGNVNGNDTVSVRYIGDATTYDCLGQQTAPDGTTEIGAVVDETFSVTNGALSCSVNSATAEPVGENVHSFSVLYGVDTQADGTPHRYLNAAAVTSAGEWGAVKSVVAQVSYDNPNPTGSTAPAALPALREVINLTELNQ